MPSKKQTLWARLRRVGMPFFTSDARWRAYAGLGVVLVLLLSINGLNVVNSYVGRDFMSALAERQPGRFYALAGMLAGVFAASTAAEVLATFAQQRLGLVWRDWLTRTLLDRYLGGLTYRRLTSRKDIDNPDQRISEDIKNFTATSLSFLVMLVNGLLTLAACAGVLWSITPTLFLVALGYAALGSFGTVALGRRLVSLNNLQLQKEADFRFALGRVRERAGDIARARGEGEEKTRLVRLLGAVVENFRAMIGVNRNVGFFTTGYGYLTQIIPAAVVAPLYVRGDVPFGTVTQSAMAFTQVLGAFSLVVKQFSDLTAYAAVVGRLGALWEATEPGPEPPAATPAPAAPAPAAAIQAVPDDRRVAYEGLTLQTPREGRVLVRDLSL
jgi:putative ATP-binding cassette transporter